ncbi:hypothetical protein J6P92_09205 [bacterium]|nr:hypothetical protein [bacterium]
MKVLPVSLSFRSGNYEKNYDSAYLYTAKDIEKKDYTPQYMFLASVTALTAVIITLFNIAGKKKIPDNIIK